MLQRNFLEFSQNSDNSALLKEGSFLKDLGIVANHSINLHSCNGGLTSDLCHVQLLPHTRDTLFDLAPRVLLSI